MFTNFDYHWWNLLLTNVALIIHVLATNKAQKNTHKLVGIYVITSERRIDQLEKELAYIKRHTPVVVDGETVLHKRF